MISHADRIDIEAAAKRYANGDRLCDIGASYGVSKAVLHKHLKKAGKNVKRSKLSEIICGYCGARFLAYPTAGRKFCSSDCGFSYMKTRPHVSHQWSRIGNIWRGMKARCYRKSTTNYTYYGGRGIAVCMEWRESSDSFYSWAMANGYADDLELDRIDTDGDYEPSNCRWASRNQQMQNTRKRSNAKTSKYKGVSLHSQNRRWIAQIGGNGATKYVGSFDSEVEAAEAYDQAAILLFGEFARLNFPRKECVIR